MAYLEYHMKESNKFDYFFKMIPVLVCTEFQVLYLCPTGSTSNFVQVPLPLPVQNAKIASYAAD